ncbi:rCG62614 [Rattus norvegicus]|uniref:RCG62614 n=1 Tax=Rattus norvegicus TaxID=10116 RepID=A6J5R5_RAT|nr:rCG62614 [Rattus norvegicus]
MQAHTIVQESCKHRPALQAPCTMLRSRFLAHRYVSQVLSMWQGVSSVQMYLP